MFKFFQREPKLKPFELGIDNSPFDAIDMDLSPTGQIIWVMLPIFRIISNNVLRTLSKDEYPISSINDFLQDNWDNYIIVYKFVDEQNNVDDQTSRQIPSNVPLICHGRIM